MRYQLGMRMSFAASLAAQDANRERARDERRRIESSAGGLAAFKQNLIVQPVVSEADYRALQLWANAHGSSPASGPRAKPKSIRQLLRRVRQQLDDFYAVYVQCFPIAAERESRKGFLELQTRGNFEQAMRRRIGGYREHMEILRAPISGQAIGGLNFTVYAHLDNAPTVHSTYAFLAPAVRGLGLAARMLEIRDRIALEYLHANHPDALQRGRGIYTFAEQNIPELMDGLSYAKDSAQAIDQIERLQKWGKLAYLPLDFEYVQPPLEEGGAPCDILSLNTYFRSAKPSARGVALGALRRPKTVDARILRNHLRAFFLQSVCKDVRADVTDATTRKTLAALDKRIARGEGVRTKSLSSVARYLTTWDARVRALQAILGDTPLSSRQTVQALFLRHEARVAELLQPARQKRA